jgi:hypothetical protein
MITKLFTWISSLLVSGSLLLSQGSPAAAAANPTPAPQTPGLTQPQAGPAPNRRWPALAWPFRGDPLVKRGLVEAAALVTGKDVLDVRQALIDGQSIAGFAAANGKSSDDVLNRYEALVQKALDQEVANGRLPASLAESRAAWFQEAGRQMIDQPRLAPAYPGLHQLHVALITAAVKVGGLERAQVRTDLQACQTLDEILTRAGHTGQEAVDFTMQRLDVMMDRLVQNGRLSAALRQSWHDSLQAALEQMITTPGLHVAGKECSH